MELNQYLDVFLDESREHIQNMSHNLLQLESHPEDLNLLNEIFRAAHTLKGMSATMGFEDMAHLTHQLENVLDLLRNNELTVTTPMIDTFMEATDHLEAILQSIMNGEDGKQDVSQTMNELKSYETQESDEGLSVEASSSNPNIIYNDYEQRIIKDSESQGFSAYEVHVKLRDDCVLKSARVFMVFEVIQSIGDIIKSVPAVEQLEDENFENKFQVTLITTINEKEIKERILKVSEIESVSVSMVNLESLNKNHSDKSSEKGKDVGEKKDKKVNQSKTTHSKVSETINHSGKTIRVNIERLDQLMNLFEELIIDRGRLEDLSNVIKVNDLTDTVERITRVSSELQNIILNLRMVPIDQVFNRFPRMVRGLGQDLNKKVHLDIIGADTELDRTIIDEIGDPLIHIIRNSMDHGIEAPEERIKFGKPAEGIIILKAYHSGNHVVIEITDDGAGIDQDIILNKAINKGLTTAEEAKELTTSEIYQFMFTPGFSTSEVITDISGRGVGLDVVKNNIEKLGGLVVVQSVIGEGTTFTIQLPLTLSIISAMLVEVQQEKYAIPLSSILETAIINKRDIQIVHREPVVMIRDHIVPLVNLKQIFQIPGEHQEGDFISLVIIRKGNQMAGLMVDSFIGQQEIVIKTLGKYLSNVFAISGATILGNGQVALILDSHALIK